MFEQSVASLVKAICKGLGTSLHYSIMQGYDM